MMEAPLSGVTGLSPTQVRIRLLQNGWAPLPIHTHDSSRHGAGKAPGIRAWAERARFEADGTTHAELKAWERKESQWPGTGIACGNAIAIDADFAADPLMAGQVRLLAFEVFGETPFERQGQAPKIALIYKAAEAIPSISLKTADGSGDGIDVLAELRQFVAFGIHWKTCKPYCWTGGESPLSASLDAAPEIDQAQVDEFLRRLRGMVELSGSGGRAGRGGGAGGGAILRDADGRVIDGREYHLTRIVYATALSMKAEGAPLAASELATRAWERFVETTVLTNGRWSFEAAREKADALLARVRCGQVSLDVEPPKTVAATYPDLRRPVDEAERAVREVVAEFFAKHVPAWVETRTAYEQEAKAAKEAELEAPEKPMPTSWGARVETAVGKTAEAVAITARAAAAGITVVYGFPTHRLGTELIARFARHGVTARVYRGYEVPDPDWTDRAMCLDLPAMRDAKEAGVRTIEAAVCEVKAASTSNGVAIRCAFFDQCGMTRQRKSSPDLWLVPHALLLSAKPKYLPNPDAIIIDEGIAMGAIPDRPMRFSLDAMERSDFIIPALRDPCGFDANDLEVARASLLRALRAHDGDGPLQRELLLRHDVTESIAAKTWRLEWARHTDPEIQPDMDPKLRSERAGQTGRHNAEVKKWAGIWDELRKFLGGVAEQSGRLCLRFDEETDSLNLERRSLSTVRGSWTAPALLIDATLPDPTLLAPVLGHEVVVKADIAARWSPHGIVRQIVGAPTTATKLGIIEGRESGSTPRVIAALLRLIQLRAALVGHDRIVVVIGAKRLIEKLVDTGLPANVETAHFGAVAGIDKWATAAGLICIGRMEPGPGITEPLAGVISGNVPEAIPTPEVGGRRYERVAGGIRLPNGQGVEVQHSRHPDPTVEALRWQICEANLIQAIGRLRALRRTEQSPFFLDILNDVPLPITVDRVETWEEASVGPWAAMASEGVLLSSAADVMACFPDLAPTRKSAREMDLPTLALTPIKSLTIGVRANVREVTYKRLGRFAPARAILLPNAPDDLKSWLFDRLGAIEWVKIATDDALSEKQAPPRAAEYAPGLIAHFNLAAEGPPEPFRPAPVRGAVLRFDSAGPISFPTVPGGKLGLKKAAEAANRVRTLEAAAR